MTKGQAFLRQTCPCYERLPTSQTALSLLARGTEETPSTPSSNSPVCRMNWVSRNSSRNRAQQISEMNGWMCCEQKAALSNPRRRTAHRRAAPAFPELEIRLLDRTSHNGTRKLASCLLRVYLESSMRAATFMSSAGIMYRKFLKFIFTQQGKVLFNSRGSGPVDLYPQCI